jgi:hypothetical protein
VLPVIQSVEDLVVKAGTFLIVYLTGATTEKSSFIQICMFHIISVILLLFFSVYQGKQSNLWREQLMNKQMPMVTSLSIQ